MKTYTKEEKQAYYKNMRDRWHAVKSTITDDTATRINAIMAERGLNFSIRSWAFVEAQMRALGWDGLPYVDTKTFQGWREAGFMVRRGEKSQIDGVTWIAADGKEEKDGEEKEHKRVFMKGYKLFHSSQVDPIGENTAHKN